MSGGAALRELTRRTLGSLRVPGLGPQPAVRAASAAAWEATARPVASALMPGAARAGAALPARCLATAGPAPRWAGPAGPWSAGLHGWAASGLRGSVGPLPAQSAVFISPGSASQTRGMVTKLKQPKKYKLKTPSALRGRFKLMKSTGDIIRHSQGFRHKRSSKSKSAKMRLKKASVVNATFAKKMRKLGFKQRYFGGR